MATELSFSNLGGRHAPGLLALVVAAGLGAAVVVGLAADSMPALVGTVGALAMAVCLVYWGQPRRMAIAALFFLAPIDVSKAIVPPQEEFFSPGLYLSPAHVVTLLLFAFWLFHRLLILRRLPPLTRLDAYALLWLAWIWFRAFGSLQGRLALATAVAYSLAVLCFYVVSHAVKDMGDVRMALKAGLLVLFIETLYSAAQMALHAPLLLPGSKGLPVSSFLTFGGAGLAFRPSGFLGYPNGLGDHMVLVLGPALALALMGRKRLPLRVWLAAMAALVAAGALLLFTLSRGGWVAFAVSALCTVVIYRIHRLLSWRQLSAAAMVLALAGVAFVAVYPQVLLRLTATDDRSTESRIILTDQAVTIIRANPWIGVGYGGYNRAAHEFTPPSFALVSEDFQKQLFEVVVHDHYLLLAAELGVPAMLFFVFILWRVIRLPFPLRRWNDPGTFAVAVGLSGSMVGQFVYFSADNYYADPRVFMFWMTAGLLQALVTMDRSRAS